MLRIHFLNVGHGDCTLIEFPSGNLALVDINNSKVLDEETEAELASINPFGYGLYKSRGYRGITLLEKSVADFVEPVDPVSYLKDKFPGKSIFRFIMTHPDMDHMSGLYRLGTEGIPIVNFWDTDNKKDVSKSDVYGKYDFNDWETYQTLRMSTDSPKVLKLLKGDQRDFFQQDGIKILSPTKELVEKANQKKSWNLLSYVLLIEYAGHKIILGGDADCEVWESLASENKELLENISILKAPHHGRNSGYCQSAVSIMKPLWTVCSVGKKPSQDAHNKYRNYTQKLVLSTRFRGNIVAEISAGGILTMSCEDNCDTENNLYPIK